jgi:hypothetical protein
VRYAIEHASAGSGRMAATPFAAIPNQIELPEENELNHSIR